MNFLSALALLLHTRELSVKILKNGAYDDRDYDRYLTARVKMRDACRR